LSEFVGDEISRVINEQRDLERKYEELVTKRGQLKGLSNKSRYKQNQIEIQEVSRALRESTKNLCRNLKDNPDVTGNLLKIQDERNELEDLLTRTITEVREKRTFSTLAAYVEEVQKEQSRLDEMVEREKKTSRKAKELEMKLQHERAHHEKEEEERTRIIEELKMELQEVRAKLSFKSSYVRREADAKFSSIESEYKHEERVLEARIEDLKRLKDVEVTVHAETMGFLQRKQAKLLQEAEEWSDRYSNELEDLDNQLQELQAARNQGLIRLNELQARWDEQEAEKKAREDAIRLEREREEKLVQDEEEFGGAAAKIQRQFKTFAASKKKEKGKKKKTGKKKKK